jgi:NADP-dependent 3-hydroxy acid dehydrogenase YdfG
MFQSVSPGMVATEFMAASERPVDPKEIYGSNPHLVAKDIADAILYVLGVPPHVQVSLSFTCNRASCLHLSYPEPV